MLFEAHLAAVETHGGRIARLVLENGDAIEAAMYVDASYEGDLLAAAGVSHHVGRESNAVYHEPLNGVHFGHPNHRAPLPRAGAGARFRRPGCLPDGLA